MAKTSSQLFGDPGNPHWNVWRGCVKQYSEHMEEDQYARNNVNPDDDFLRMSAHSAFAWTNRKVSDSLYEYAKNGVGKDEYIEQAVEFLSDNEEIKLNIYRNTRVVEKGGETVAETIVEYEGYDKDGDGTQETEDDEEEKEKWHEYPKLHKIGVIDDKMRLRIPKLKGTMLAFVKDVDEIKGTKPNITAQQVADAWFRWMQSKVGQEWPDFTVDHLYGEGYVQYVDDLWENHDSFRDIAESKYEYAPDELSPNGDPDDGDEEPDGDEEQEINSEDRKSRRKRAQEEVERIKRQRGSGSSSSSSKSNKGSNNGSEESGLGDFAEQYGAAEDIGRPDNGRSNGTGQASLDETEENETDKDTSEGKGGGNDSSAGSITDYASTYGTADSAHPEKPELEVNRIIHGDSKEVMLNMRANTVDMIITSPPYWALRDYDLEDEQNWEDGKWVGQLGHEPTPDLFVEHLQEVWNACGRVLKPKGTLWINIDDTFGGKPGGYYDNEDYEGDSMGHEGKRPSLDVGDSVPSKALALVPERMVLRMYEEGWYCRNKIQWAKQVIFPDDTSIGATMPTAVKDRVNEKASEPLYMFFRDKDYYFDLDPIRRPHKTEPGKGKHFSEDAKSLSDSADGDLRRDFADEEMYHDKGGNISNVWQINPARSPDSHFAAFPQKLVERPIKAACPEGGVVLDPFAGTGTTCKVAAELGRHYIGIDASEKYVQIARKNVPKSTQTTLQI